MSFGTDVPRTPNFPHARRDLMQELEQQYLLPQNTLRKEWDALLNQSKIDLLKPPAKTENMISHALLIAACTGLISTFGSQEASAQPLTRLTFSLPFLDVDFSSFGSPSSFQINTFKSTEISLFSPL